MFTGETNTLNHLKITHLQPGIKTVCICAFVIKRKSGGLRESMKPELFVAVCLC